MKYNPNIVRAFFKECGLDEPHEELVFAPPRKWRFDFAWPYYNVALEVEGGVFVAGRHTRGSGFAKDLEKYSEAAALGWLVLRVQPRDLCTAATVDLVKRAMQSQRSPLQG